MQESIDPSVLAKFQAVVERAEALATRNAELEAQLANLRTTSAYRERPDSLRGRTVQATVGCGPMYVTLNEDEDGRPFEVFFKLGKSGSCQQSHLEALGVAMSVGLRYGADPQKYIDKLRGMRCPNPILRDAQSAGVLSCADGISQGLSAALEIALLPPPVPGSTIANVVAEPKATIDLIGGATPPPPILTQENRAAGMGMCPTCSGPLAYKDGDSVCESCGFTKGSPE